MGIIIVTLPEVTEFLGILNEIIYYKIALEDVTHYSNIRNHYKELTVGF